MRGTKAATRYATALLEFSVEKNVLDDVFQDMVYLHSLVLENYDFQSFLKNPIIDSEKKKEIFSSIFGQFNPVTIQFIHLMAHNKRENILLDISASFIDQYKTKNGIVPVTITSAQKLEDKVRKEILEKIKKEVNGKIELTELIDASLIGGFMVRM
ncbi:MAG: ATP synthase F1 subunit delta, partial [Crocinitomicaceae bacterium]